MRVAVCVMVLLCVAFAGRASAQVTVTVNLAPNYAYDPSTKEAPKCLATIESGQKKLRIKPNSTIVWTVNNKSGAATRCDKHVRDSDIDIVFKDPGVTGKTHGNKTTVTTGNGTPGGTKVVRYTVTYDSFVVEDPEIDIDPTAPVPDIPPGRRRVTKARGR